MGRLSAAMAIFTSLLVSPHSHNLYVWSLGCGGGTVGCRKVIAVSVPGSLNLMMERGEWVQDA